MAPRVFVCALVALVVGATLVAPVSAAQPQVHTVQKVHKDKTLTSHAKQHLKSHVSDPADLICNMSERGEIDETADALTGAFRSALLFFQGDTVCPSFPDGVTLISTMELFFLSGGPLGRIQPVTFQNRVCQISVCGAFVAFDTTNTGDYDAIYTTIFQAPPGTFWTSAPLDPGCTFSSPDQTAFSCTLDIPFTLI